MRSSNEFKKTIKGIALAAAVCLAMTGCASNNSSPEETTASAAADSSAAETTVPTGFFDDVEADLETYVSAIELKEGDTRAIYKFECDTPEGYTLVTDSAEGKFYVNEEDETTVIVKATNYKDQYKDLEVFADQSCAAMKVTNMLYQTDSEFSEPSETTVAGFRAIRYNYDLTSWIFTFVTDENEAVVTKENGDREIESKDIYLELSDRAYFFYSDNDVFYVIFETTKSKKDQAAAGIEAFLEGIRINEDAEMRDESEMAAGEDEHDHDHEDETFEEGSEAAVTEAPSEEEEIPENSDNTETMISASEEAGAEE